GLEGGEAGKAGVQTLTRADGGEPERLPAITAFDANPGDVLRIETPGGGAWGAGRD
ncbi:MAG: hydantoinase B/oxoprolinase family protein, partial [Verrucomicrobiae bacterium]|nr:hydantoinase B/oxoprolinase family protein [Verrucomicrobiae bacterium]